MAPQVVHFKGASSRRGEKRKEIGASSRRGEKRKEIGASSRRGEKRKEIGASSRGEKRKERGASELTVDGRKKKKAPEKRHNSRKGLNSKASLVAEEDLNLGPEAIRDPDLDAITDLVLDRQLRMFHSRQKGFDWDAQPMDIIGIYKVYGLNDAIPIDSQVELPELCTLKIPPLIMEVDGQMVDLMKEIEVELPEKI
ncbi:hypothetical protein LWI29_037164 [Acer saccharum]|uniref:Uncharacterized protein n=1 Tax=Acer saccharum TaxID=4024 RepID=A0AA39RGD7_ACESA|nr:hypothetical protein LWI29_037164 [Acer saccharum]